eukprot:gene7357-24008_t
MSLIRVDPNQLGADSLDDRNRKESSSSTASSTFASFRKQHAADAAPPSFYNASAAVHSSASSAAVTSFSSLSSHPSSVMMMMVDSSSAAGSTSVVKKRDSGSTTSSSSTPAPPPDNQMVWGEVMALQGQVKQLSQKLSNERKERRKLREGFDLLKEMYTFQSAVIVRLERKVDMKNSAHPHPHPYPHSHSQSHSHPHSYSRTNGTVNSHANTNVHASASAVVSRHQPSTDSHGMFRSTPSEMGGSVVGVGPMMSSNVGSHIKANSSEGSALIRRNSSLRLAGDGSFRPVFDSSSRPPSAFEGEGSSLIRRTDSFQISGDGSLRLAGERSRIQSASPAAANLAAIQCHVRKIDGKLGLGLAGGDGADSLPLHVCDVPADGAAAAHGGISVGDRVLSIDGMDMSAAVYTDAVDALLATGDVVRLELLRDPQLRTQLNAAHKRAALAAAVARSQAPSVVSSRDHPSGPSLSNSHMLDDLYDDQANERRGKAAARAEVVRSQDDFKRASFGPELSPIRASTNSPAFSEEDGDRATIHNHHNLDSNKGGDDRGGGSAMAFNLSHSTPPRASTPPTEESAGGEEDAESPGIPPGHVHSFVCGRLAARGFTARCQANEASTATERAAAESEMLGAGANPNPKTIMTFDNDELLSPGLSPVMWGSYDDKGAAFGGSAEFAGGSGSSAGGGAGGGGASSPGDAGDLDCLDEEYNYSHGTRVAGNRRGAGTSAAAVLPPPPQHRTRLPVAGTPKVVRDRDLPDHRSAAYRSTREGLLENPFNSPRLRRKGNRRFEVAPTDFAARVLSQPIEELQPVAPPSSTSPPWSSKGSAGDGDGVGRVNALMVGSSLGITISGGTSISPKPGIYIMAVTADGAAACEGTLCPQDRILSVDGIDMRNASRTDAVGVLKNVGTEVNMIVARMRTKGGDGIIELTLVYKAAGGGVGREGGGGRGGGRGGRSGGGLGGGCVVPVDALAEDMPAQKMTTNNVSEI